MNGEAGKGSKPRNCFSKEFRDGFDYALRKLKCPVCKEPLKELEPKSLLDIEYTLTYDGDCVCENEQCVEPGKQFRYFWKKDIT